MNNLSETVDLRDHVLGIKRKKERKKASSSAAAR
jgi:hypothetical protein